MIDPIAKAGTHGSRDSSSTQLNPASFQCAGASPRTAAVATPGAKVGQEPTENASTRHADPIRVALIDALQFSRDCLGRAFHALNQGLAVIPFASIEECVGAEHASFDVVLYCNHDDGAFEKVTLQYVKALRDRFGEVPVVVLSDAREALQIGSIRRVLDSGARGLVPTITTEVPAVLSAIRFVKDGGTFVPIDLMLSKRAPRPAADGDEIANRLTPRQKTVLSHLRLGKQNKIIAYELGMTESTVKVHIRNIMRKTGATNRTQAVYNSQQLGTY
ncbi:MAG TPA: response regulator transcription factor [Acetobacteraceae bacterium]|jgi:DNA-binding NarL/FixJ family response regulator|nr:response regulator transcription factor [Acetobacteraceae bacterium]